MLAEPGVTSGPNTVFRTVYGACTAPYIGVVMQRPATAAVHGGTLATLYGYFFYQLQKRLVHFGQGSGFCRPIIHFYVNVGGVLPVPGSAQLIVPDALQVGGLSTRL